MLINKAHTNIGISLLLISPIAWAEPPLKIHIFDKKEQEKSLNKVAQPPLLKMHIFEQQQPPTTQVTQTPHLEVHVFDNSPAVKNNAVLAKRYAKDKPKETLQEVTKLPLSYVKSESYIKMGYRKDDLQWSIAGPEGVPNILSELTWKDIKMATISSGTTLLFESNWLINFNLLFGNIYNGENQDSDYLGDNRTIEFSRSNNSGDEGSVLDLSVSTGYSWIYPLNQLSTSPNIELRPQIGLSYYSQNLKITDGNQTISEIEDLPLIGPFPGANGTYDATWFGPWLGLKSKFSFTDSFSLSLNFEYHYAKYSSTADWNLRADFSHPENFTQKADGYGLIGDIEGEYRLNKQLSLNLSVKYQDWQAHDNGVDKTFFSDDTALTTEYNGVDWKSFGTNIGIVYSF